MVARAGYSGDIDSPLCFACRQTGGLLLPRKALTDLKTKKRKALTVVQGRLHPQSPHEPSLSMAHQPTNSWDTFSLQLTLFSFSSCEGF
jgi:hypothetical protein